MTDPILPTDDAIAGGPPPPAPAPDPKIRLPTDDEIADGNQDPDRFKVAVGKGFEQDPARAAQVLGLQAQTRLPTDLIDRHLDEVKQAASQGGFNPDEYRRTSPVVAQWLSEDPTRIGLTRNDLPQLAQLEMQIRRDPKLRYEADGSISQTSADGNFYTNYPNVLALRQALLERGDLADLRKMDAQGVADQNGILTGPLYTLTAGVAAIRNVLGTGQDQDIMGTIRSLHEASMLRTGPMNWFSRQLGDLELDIGAGGAAAVGSTARMLGGVSTSQQDQLQEASNAYDPSILGGVFRGAGGFIADAPLMVAGGAIGRAAVGVSRALTLSKTMEHVVSGMASMQPFALRDAALQAQKNGTGQGLLSWAIDSGIGGAFGPLAVQKAIIGIGEESAEQAASRIILKAAGLNASQMMTLDLADRLQAHANGSDPHALDWDQLGPSLAVSGILGLGAGTVFAVPEAWKAARAIHDGAGDQLTSMLRAGADAQRLRNIADIATSTESLELHQDSIQNLVQRLADDTGIRTLYVDGDAWKNHYSEAKEDPRTAWQALQPHDPMGYDKAIESHGQVAIPLEAFVGQIARGEHLKWFIDEARTSPSAMNDREQNAMVERLVKEQQEAEKAKPAASEPSDMEQGANLVHEDIKRQLLQGGASETVAEHQAALWRGVFHATGERFTKAGGTFDPWEEYQKQKVHITRDIPELLGNPTKKGQLDLSIEQLKRGEIPSEEDISRAEGRTSREPREYDAIDAVNENGGIAPAGDKAGGEYDAFKAMEPNLRRMSTRKAGGLRIDQMAQALKQDGVGDGTPEGLVREIEKAGRSRAQQKAEPKGEPSPRADELRARRTGLLQLRDHLAAMGVDLQKEDTPTIKKKLLGVLHKAMMPGKGEDEGIEDEEVAQKVKRTLTEDVLDSAKESAADDLAENVKEGLDVHIKGKKGGRAESEPFEQEGEDGEGPQGTFLPKRLNPEGENVFKIMQTANLSTFLHESGHFLLEFMQEMAARPDAPESLKTDLGVIRDWLGLKPGEAISRAQHEDFARGLEAYLLAGRAPSPGLRSAFARFARWLTDIYKNVAGLRVNVSPEVRAVFDRLLATDDEIKRAQAEAEIGSTFATKEEAGWTQEQWDRYQTQLHEANQLARSILEREAMRGIRDEQAERYQTEREAMRLKVADEINQRPVYTAMLVLQRGAWPEGIDVPEGMERIKLDKQDIIDRKGQAGLDMLPGPMRRDAQGQEIDQANRGRRLYSDDKDRTRLTLDQAAALFGFKDGDDLFRHLTNAPDRVKTIEAETDMRMKAKFPDPYLNGELREKARAAVNNDERLKMMQDEIAALALKSGRPVTPSQLLKAVAVRTVLQERAMDLRPDRYRVAMTRAGKLAVRLTEQARTMPEGADKKALLGEAQSAKEKELLNAHLYRAADAARERSDKDRQYLDTWNTAAKRARIGKAGGWAWTVNWKDATGADQSREFAVEEGRSAEQTQELASAFARQHTGADVSRTGYVEQADGIMEGYDLKRASNKALGRRESLRQWIARKLADDEPVNIGEQVINDLGRRNWKELTVAEQHSVVDALRNIESLANKKNKLLAGERRETLQEQVKGLVDNIKENVHEKTPVRIGRGPLDSVVDAIGSFFTIQRTVSSKAFEGDGFKRGGNFFEALVRPFNDANDVQLKYQEESTKAMLEIYKRWGKIKPGDIASLNWKTTTQGGIGVGVSHWTRMMMAMNWGNADNRQRLMDGYGASSKQIEAELDRLDAKDVRMVQDVWDHIDTYWPLIKAKIERTMGIAPDKVQATPWITKFGVMRGGYFPIKYDPKSLKKNVIVESEAKLQTTGARLAATTERGHTEQRTGMPAGARILLDPTVIAQHLNQVIHDLAYHEALIDRNRLLKNDDFHEAVERSWGDNTFRAFQSQTKDVALGVHGAQNGLDKILEHARLGTLFATRALNIGTALQQAAGIPQAVVRVGPKYWAKAAVGLFKNPMATENTFKWVEEQSIYMRNRSKTFDKNIADTMGGVDLRGPIRKAMDGVGYYFWTKAFQFLDTHTWLASYMKAMDDYGNDHAKAVSIADTEVSDIQGSGATKDLPAVMRGGALAQVFTGSMSWWLANHNLTMEAINRTRGGTFKDFLKCGCDLFVLYGVQVAAWSALEAALTGKNKQDWDNPSDLALRLSKDAAYTAMSSMVLMRDVADQLVEGEDYHGPYGLRGEEYLGKLFKNAHDLWQSEFYPKPGQRFDTPDKRAAALGSSAGRVAGVIFHLPVTEMANIFDALTDDKAAQAQSPAWTMMMGRPQK